MSADLRDVLGSPFVRGGRQVGVALDCLGVVGAVAARRGLPPPDGWASIKAAWERGEIDAASGFPAGWTRQPPGTVLQSGDVLVYVRGGWPGCAIVDGGLVLTSSPETGAYACPLQRWQIKPQEVWRFQS
jgi:hypothetical protein